MEILQLWPIHASKRSLWQVRWWLLDNHQCRRNDVDSAHKKPILGEKMCGPCPDECCNVPSALW